MPIMEPSGIPLSEHTYARGELVFRPTCVMALEGIAAGAKAAGAVARHESCFVLAGLGTFWRVPMAELLRATHRTFASLTPVRVITGVAVFAFGLLSGASFAAWLMPPP
jgi:hypothetical protein